MEPEIMMWYFPSYRDEAGFRASGFRSFILESPPNKITNQCLKMMSRKELKKEKYHCKIKLITLQNYKDCRENWDRGGYYYNFMVFEQFDSQIKKWKKWYRQVKLFIKSRTKSQAQECDGK